MVRCSVVCETRRPTRRSDVSTRVVTDRCRLAGPTDVRGRPRRRRSTSRYAWTRSALVVARLVDERQGRSLLHRMRMNHFLDRTFTDHSNCMSQPQLTISACTDSFCRVIRTTQRHGGFRKKYNCTNVTSHSASLSPSHHFLLFPSSPFVAEPPKREDWGHPLEK